MRLKTLFKAVSANDRVTNQAKSSRPSDQPQRRSFSQTYSAGNTAVYRSSSLVTLARPSVSSSLQITNRSFTYASPHLWNQLPSSFRQPHSIHCPPGSPHPAHITLLESPPIRSHHLSLPLHFTPDLKLISFTNPFTHSHVTLIPSTDFTDLNLY